MSELISGRLHGLLSRNSNKHPPQTRAEKILALERIKDPKAREQAIAWQLKLQKIVDIGALTMLPLLLIFAGLYIFLSPIPSYTAVCTWLLSYAGVALIRHVLNS
jgi:hypothetical protein